LSGTLWKKINTFHYRSW